MPLDYSLVSASGLPVSSSPFAEGVRAVDSARKETRLAVFATDGVCFSISAHSSRLSWLEKAIE